MRRKLEPYTVQEGDIGKIVRRYVAPKQKNHLIQSVVEGGAFTKCGRRMKRVDARGEGLLVASTNVITCEGCQ